jgi:RHS repeat-associated protein
MGCLKLTYYPETSPLKVVKDFSFSVEKRGAGSYRYGFNGKELDRDEEGMGGGGSTYDYGFRIYNPALAKFLSVDPVVVDYPHLAPYQFAENTPIVGIDLEGKELFFPSTFWGWSNTMIMMEQSSVVPRVPISEPVIESIVKTNVPKPAPSSPNWTWGTRVHRIAQEGWERFEGFQTEQWLGRIGGKGNRIDGLKFEQIGEQLVGTLRELKPNSTWGRSAGYQQLARYLEAAKQKYPLVDKWVQELHLYEQAPNQANAVVGQFYTVQNGDVLGAIALKFNTTVENLAALNNISNIHDIKAGEEIMIDFTITKSPVIPTNNVEPKDNTVVVTKPVVPLDQLEE